MSQDWRHCIYNVLPFILLVTSVAAAQEKYFPPDFPSNWYVGDLRALKESSLWEASKMQKTQSYRFLWLRSFNHSIAIRIDVNADGTSSLIEKMTGGVTGHPGKLIQNRTITLNHEETDLFLERVERSEFWKLQLPSEGPGVDGTRWIMEGARNGKYHIVDQWSPKHGEIRGLALYMIEGLAKIRLARNEIY
jgi:hypothetical protein